MDGTGRNTGRDGQGEQDGRPRRAATLAVIGEELRTGLGEGVDLPLDLAAFAAVVAEELPRALAAGHTEATLRADELIRAGAPVGIVRAEVTLDGGEVLPAIAIRLDGEEAFLDFAADGGRGPLRAGCTCSPDGFGGKLCAHQVAGLIVLEIFGRSRGLTPPPSRYVGTPPPRVPETAIEEVDLRAALASARRECRTAEDRATLDAAAALIRGRLPIAIVPHQQRHPAYPGRDLSGARTWVAGETVTQLDGGDALLLHCTCGELRLDRLCVHAWAARVALEVENAASRRDPRSRQQRPPAPRPPAPRGARQQRRAADRAARRARRSSTSSEVRS